MNKNIYLAIGTLVGGTIGAGLLGLPYVISKSGFLIGLVEMVIIMLAILFLNLALGEVIQRTKGKHQLTGYCELYLGKYPKYAMTFAMVFGIIGAMIAYMIGSGEALSEMFGGNPLNYSLVFFIILSIIILLGLNVAKKYESVLVTVSIVFISMIILYGIFNLKLDNLSYSNNYNLLIPYGAIFFASLALPAVIESNEELMKNKKLLKKAIVIGTLIPFFIHVLFVIAIVGSLGMNVSEIATLSIKESYGSLLGFIGMLFPVLTMGTAFLVLGIALKEMFVYDFKMKELYAWMLTCLPPAFIVMLGFHDFIKAISVVGGLVAGIDGLLITMMWIKSKKIGKLKPSYVIPKNWFIICLILIIFSIGILTAVLSLFK